MIEDIINPTPARQLINDFYYQLPNNGFLKEGLLSCERRYNEAIICALVCIDKMITIAPWGGVIDDEYEWHINNVPRKNSETYYNETYGGGK